MFSFSQGTAKDASDKLYQWQTFVICNPNLSLFCSIVAASKLIAFDLSNHKGLLSDILHQIVRQCSAVGHFTVVGLVTLLLRESEADLVLIQTFFLLQF